ncbi:diguanylate cyclase AdrA, partial [Enterobacter hormaechei]
MMNDEFYDSHENIREAWHQQLSQDDSYRSGLRFARRIRLARIVGLAALFVPLA